MDDREQAKRRKELAYRNMLEAIRDRTLRFLQVAPAKERRGEIEVVARACGITACQPELCSIELVNRADLIIVRCHTCKRGGTWRFLASREK